VNNSSVGVQMRKLILGTASILALEIGGATLFPAGADNTVPKAASSKLPASGASRGMDAADPLKDDIRWAQLELRNIGLYKGSLDGILGPETKRAVEQFQRNNGLNPTATVDDETMEVLTGNHGMGQGSSTASNTAHPRSNKNWSGASNSGQ
jgi:peptidoglycan hydrolase-like protein with peptidoglycan-binding domain